MKSLWIMLCLLSLGCAGATPQTDRLLLQRPAPYVGHLIEGVPFIEQTAGNCGPATLTMALRWAGKSVSVEEVATQVYTPGMQGSFQVDMLTASRRQGLMAVPIAGLEALLQEVNAGHPVIVFENLSVSWLPQWHYAIVFGFDLPAQKIIMHSGPEAHKSWDLRKFERSWSLGGYWGLVVLRPGQLSASAGEIDQVAAAAGLEQIGQVDAALISYQNILKKWPQSLLARIGLANIAYAQKDYHTARNLLKQAKRDHPGSAVAWHNSVFAEAADGKELEARQSAIEALRLAEPQTRIVYGKSLKKWLR